jgi:hypothetical protein
MSNRINPRYVAYAKFHGRSARAQLAHDEQQYPGGKMCGFICWIAESQLLFYRAHPECFIDNGHTIHNQRAWTKFLRERGRCS